MKPQQVLWGKINKIKKPNQTYAVKKREDANSQIRNESDTSLQILQTLRG